VNEKMKLKMTDSEKRWKSKYVYPKCSKCGRSMGEHFGSICPMKKKR
jgi:hypothetical protein